MLSYVSANMGNRYLLIIVPLADVLLLFLSKYLTLDCLLRFSCSLVPGSKECLADFFCYIVYAFFKAIEIWYQLNY